MQYKLLINYYKINYYSLFKYPSRNIVGCTQLSHDYFRSIPTFSMHIFPSSDDMEVQPVRVSKITTTIELI